MNIAWFSCGATSAVACMLALEKYEDVEIIYIDTGSHHPDNERFIKDCEKWYQETLENDRHSGIWFAENPIKIKRLQSRYTSVTDVIRRTRFVNSPYGASCTKMLKTRVRQEYEYNHPEIENHIWGFESGAKEENRAIRMKGRYPEYGHLFPLIENGLTKSACLEILKINKIKLPEMYKLGYQNNNCIGCVKGGMGYWNKIRVDFPEQFNEMALVEREIGHSCLKQYFLDELPPDAGRNQKTLLPDCGIFCNNI